jgi:hypothetical protein
MAKYVMKDLIISISLMASSLPLAELNVFGVLLLPSIYILAKMLKTLFCSKS